jgi:hypothetical protein
MSIIPTITIIDNVLQRPRATNLQSTYPIITDNNTGLSLDDRFRTPETIGGTSVGFRHLTLKTGIGEISNPLVFSFHANTGLTSVREETSAESGDWNLYLAADQQGWGSIQGQLFLSKAEPNFSDVLLHAKISETRDLYARLMASLTIDHKYLGQTELTTSIAIINSYTSHLRVDNDTVIYEDLTPGAFIDISGIITPSSYLYLNANISSYRKPLIYHADRSFELQPYPAEATNYQVYIASNQDEWDTINPLYKGQMLFIDKAYDPRDGSIPEAFPFYLGRDIYLEALYIGEVALSFDPVSSVYDDSITGLVCRYCFIVNDEEGKLSWTSPDNNIDSYGELRFNDESDPIRTIGGTSVVVDGLSNLLKIFHYRPCLFGGRYITPKFEFEDMITGNYNVYLASSQQEWDEIFGEGVRSNLFLTDAETDFVMNDSYFENNTGFWYNYSIDPYQASEDLSSTQLKETFPIKYGVGKTLHAMFLAGVRLVVSEDGLEIERVTFNKKYPIDKRLSLTDQNDLVFNDDSPTLNVDGYPVSGIDLNLRKDSFYFRYPLTKDGDIIVQSVSFPSGLYNVYIAGIENWSDIISTEDYSGQLFVTSVDEDSSQDWFPYIKEDGTTAHALCVGQVNLSVELVRNSYTQEVTFRITETQLTEGSDSRLSFDENNSPVFIGGPGTTEEIGNDHVPVDNLNLREFKKAYKSAIKFDFMFLRGLSFTYQYYDAYTTRYDTSIATLSPEWSLINEELKGKMFLRPVWASLIYYNNGMDPFPGMSSFHTEFPVSAYSMGSFSWIFKAAVDPYTKVIGHWLEYVSTNDFYPQGLTADQINFPPSGFYQDIYGNAFYDSSLDLNFDVDADWLEASGGTWDNPQYLHLPVYHYTQHFLRPKRPLERIGESLFENEIYNIFLGSNQEDWFYQVDKGRNYKGKMFLSLESPDNDGLLKIPYLNDNDETMYLESKFMGSVSVTPTSFLVKGTNQLRFDTTTGDFIYRDEIETTMEVDNTEVDTSETSLLDAPGRYRLPLVVDPDTGFVSVTQELDGNYNVYMSSDKQEWEDFEYGYRANLFLSKEDCDPLTGIINFTTPSGTFLKAIKVGVVNFDWGEGGVYVYRYVNMEALEIVDPYSTVTPDGEWIREIPSTLMYPGEQEPYPIYQFSRIGPGQPRPPLVEKFTEESEPYFEEGLWEDGEYSVFFGDPSFYLNDMAHSTGTLIFFSQSNESVFTDLGGYIEYLGTVSVTVTTETSTVHKPLFLFDEFQNHSEMLTVTTDKTDLVYEWKGPQPTWLPGLKENQVLDSETFFDHICLGPYIYRNPLYTSWTVGVQTYWEDLEQHLPIRKELGSVLMGDTWYILGGYKYSFIGGDYPSDYELSNLFETYSIAGGEWSTINNEGNWVGNTSRPRRNHTLEYYDEHLYSFGGEGSYVYNAFDLYDTNSGQWDKLLPQFFTSSVVYDNKIYVWGGCYRDASEAIPDLTKTTNSMLVYDIEKDTWSQGVSGGSPSAAGLSLVYNNKMYCLAEGWNIYNFDTQTWSTGALLPDMIGLDTVASTNNAYGQMTIGRANFIYDNKLYFPGTPFIYDFIQDEWRSELPMTLFFTGYIGSMIYGLGYDIDKKLYLWGGNSETPIWTKILPMPDDYADGWMYYKCISIDNSIYFVGARNLPDQTLGEVFVDKFNGSSITSGPPICVYVPPGYSNLITFINSNFGDVPVSNGTFYFSGGYVFGITYTPGSNIRTEAWKDAYKDPIMSGGVPPHVMSLDANEPVDAFLGFRASASYDFYVGSSGPNAHFGEDLPYIDCVDISARTGIRMFIKKLGDNPPAEDIWALQENLPIGPILPPNPPAGPSSPDPGICIYGSVAYSLTFSYSALTGQWTTYPNKQDSYRGSIILPGPTVFGICNDWYFRTDTYGTDSWTELKPDHLGTEISGVSGNLRGQAGVFYDGKYYTLGMYDYNNPTTAQIRTVIFDPATKKCSIDPTVAPIEPHYVQMVEVNGKMYCFGWYYKDSPSKVIKILNLGSMTWSSIPVSDEDIAYGQDSFPLYYMESTYPFYARSQPLVNSGIIYCWLGTSYNAIGSIPTFVYDGQHSLKTYNTITDAWNVKTNPHGHTSVVINDNLYICGGLLSSEWLGGFVSHKWTPTLYFNTNLQIFNLSALDLPTYGTPSPTPRWDHTATVWNGLMFVYGGYTDVEGTEVSDLLESYNPNTDTWMTVSNGGTPRAGHTAALHENKLYFWGGYDADGNYLNTTDTYSLTSGWSTGLTGGNARAEFASGVTSDALFVWGGDSSGDASLVQDYVFRRMTLSSIRSIASKEIATADRSLSYTWNVDVVPMEPGYWCVCVAPLTTEWGDYAGKIYLAKSDIYYAIASHWNDLGQHLPIRKDLGSIIVGDNWYILGGYKYASPTNYYLSNLFESYDTSSGDWTTINDEGDWLGNSARPRQSHTLNEYDGSLYSYGGEGSYAYNAFDTYDINTGEWSKIVPQIGASNVVYEGKLYLWSGGVQKGLDESTPTVTQLTNALSIYDFETETWEIGVAGGIPRISHNAVVYGNKMYGLGGFTAISSGGILSGFEHQVDVYNFDTKIWSTVSPIPSIITSGSGISTPMERYSTYSGPVGVDFSIGVDVNRVFISNNKLYFVKSPVIYDFLADEWRTEIPLNISLCVCLGSTLYCFGSDINKNYYFWRHPVGTNTWEIESDIPSGFATGAIGYYPPEFHYALEINGSLYFAGTQVLTSYSHYRDTLVVYKYSGGSWTSSTRGPFTGNNMGAYVPFVFFDKIAFIDTRNPSPLSSGMGTTYNFIGLLQWAEEWDDYTNSEWSWWMFYTNDGHNLTQVNWVAPLTEDNRVTLHWESYDPDLGHNVTVYYDFYQIDICGTSGDAYSPNYGKTFILRFYGNKMGTAEDVLPYREAMSDIPLYISKLPPDPQPASSLSISSVATPVWIDNGIYLTNLYLVYSGPYVVERLKRPLFYNSLSRTYEFLFGKSDDYLGDAICLANGFELVGIPDGWYNRVETSSTWSQSQPEAPGTIIPSSGVFWGSRYYSAGLQKSYPSAPYPSSKVLIFNPLMRTYQVGIDAPREYFYNPQFLLYNNDMYVFPSGGGGYYSHEEHHHLDVLNLSAQTWNSLTFTEPLIQGRFDMYSDLYYGPMNNLLPNFYAIYNGKFYGGAIPLYNKYGTNKLDDLYEGQTSFRIYDIASNTWSVKVNPKKHSAVVIGDTIYIWGGLLDSPWIGAIDETEYWAHEIIMNAKLISYSFSTSSFSYDCTPSSTPRWNHTATVWNGLMIVFGGYLDVEGTQVTNLLEYYNPNTDTWRTWISGGTPRAGHMAALHRDKLYIWGGYDSTGTQINTLDIFNLRSGRWTVGEAGGIARADFASGFTTDSLFIWGGVAIGDASLVQSYDF